METTSAGGDGRITICHWSGGGGSGKWNALEISTSSLDGHTNHGMDIIPPVEGVTPGHNWPQGEAVYLNGCVIAASTEPSPTSSTGAPSPSSTLPPTGPGSVLAMSLAGIALLLAGMYLIMKVRQRR